MRRYQAVARALCAVVFVSGACAGSVGRCGGDLCASSKVGGQRKRGAGYPRSPGSAPASGSAK
jgi:hypothetical protein